MASDETKVSGERYMECLLGIDTKTGWEKSVTKVLSSFQDISFDIDPLMGLANVKGKINPHIVLKKLNKGGKHAKIQWVTYGPEKSDDQYYRAIQPYVSIPQIGHHNFHNNYNYLYGNYNHWHNNNIGHLLPNNTPPQHNRHPPPKRCRERRSSGHHLYQHKSPVLSSSTVPSSSAGGRVSEPIVVKQRAAASVGLDKFIKKIVYIKKVTKKFLSCFDLVSMEKKEGK